MAGLRPDCLPRARPSPRRCQLHRPHPHRAPPQLEGPRKAGLAGKSGLPRPCPTSKQALAERPQVERQEGRAATPTRPTSWPASPLPTMTAARRGSPIARNDDAGPSIGTTPKLPRSAQDARNRARTGEGSANPQKTPLRASYAVFRRRRAPGRALAVPRPCSVSVGLVKFL